MPLRILIDARRRKDFGIATYTRSLIQALSQIDRENHYILLSLPEDAHELRYLPPNFEIALYRRRQDDPLDHIALPAYLRSFSADLYHIPLNRVPLFMLKPYVVTIHDMASLLFEQRHGLRAAPHRFRFRRGLLRADRIIVVSAATRRDVEQLLGIPSDRIRLVYNAPDPEFSRHGHLADARAAGPAVWEREKRRILERYQINYPFLLYAGNIRPQKNIPRLIEAFAVVHHALEGHPVYSNLHLIIIGDEISTHPALRQAVLESRVEQVVRFLGFVPFDTLRVFYESAAAFAFPSLYEGFGLPPLEAMAAGTPVVSSSVSSLPEVVGDAAVLVNPENVFDIARGIKDVLLDCELRQRLICKGKQQAAKFSWERTAREVLAIYEEVGRGK